jgi:Na+-transporting NADH:ubiquinone oxidoreductase subunit NqrE
MRYKVSGEDRAILAGIAIVLSLVAVIVAIIGGICIAAQGQYNERVIACVKAGGTWTEGSTSNSGEKCVQ